MAYSVDTAWTQEFDERLKILVQQKNSVLENTVITSTEEGEYLFEDRVAAISHGNKTTSNAATTFSDVDHTKRSVTFIDKVLNLYVDKRDVLRMSRGEGTLIQSYTELLAADYKRVCDDTIITAFLAAVNEGKAVNDTFTTVNFDTANQTVDVKYKAGDAIGAGNGTTTDTYGTGDYGLTLAKLLKAKSVLVGNHAVAPGDEIYVVLSEQEEIDLYNINEFKSGDFSRVMPYDMGIDPNGYIGNWLGMHFLRSTRLAVTDPAGADNQYRSCFAYTTSAMKFRKPTGLTIEIAKNPERNMAFTINSQFSVGAVRLEEEKVVEIRTASGMAGQDAS